ALRLPIEIAGAAGQTACHSLLNAALCRHVLYPLARPEIRSRQQVVGGATVAAAENGSAGAIGEPYRIAILDGDDTRPGPTLDYLAGNSGPLRERQIPEVVHHEAVRTVIVVRLVLMDHIGERVDCVRRGHA